MRVKELQDQVNCFYHHYQREGVNYVRIELWITRGSMDDLPGKQGIAHLLEHLLVTKIRKTLSLFEQTEVYGYTGPKRIRIKFCIPVTDIKNKLRHIIASILSSKWDGFEDEKRRIVEEIRCKRSSAHVKLIEKTEQKVLGLKNASCLGDAEEVRLIRQKDLQAYWNDICANEMFLIVTDGPGDGMNIREILQTFFSMIEKETITSFFRIPPITIPRLTKPDLDDVCHYLFFSHTSEVEYAGELLTQTYLSFLQETGRSWTSRTNYGAYSIIYFELSDDNGQDYLPDRFDEMLWDYECQRQEYIQDDPEAFLYQQADYLFSQMFGMKQEAVEPAEVLRIVQKKKEALHVYETV